MIGVEQTVGTDVPLGDCQAPGAWARQWERYQEKGIRNLEGEAQPIVISFRTKPPPYAISWRVFQRIAEHRPRVRNFGKGGWETLSRSEEPWSVTSVKVFTWRGRTCQLRSKFSMGEDVHVNFGANKLNKTSNKRCLYCVRIAAVFHTPSASPSHHHLVLMYKISCTPAAKSNKLTLRTFPNS
jgi:hypothetical protein